MKSKNFDELLKEHIRYSLGTNVSDCVVEGLFDRIKARVKGSSAGYKAALKTGSKGLVNKAMGRTEKGYSVKDDAKKSASIEKDKAISKQITGTYIEKINKELYDFENDFKKMFDIKGEIPMSF